MNAVLVRFTKISSLNTSSSSHVSVSKESTEVEGNPPSLLHACWTANLVFTRVLRYFTCKDFRHIQCSTTSNNIFSRFWGSCIYLAHSGNVMHLHVQSTCPVMSGNVNETIPKSQYWPAYFPLLRKYELQSVLCAGVYDWLRSYGVLSKKVRNAKTFVMKYCDTNRWMRALTSALIGHELNRINSSPLF